jgi:serine-type D-Ala-D-Ala carboxypeptidase/endopeptidase
MKKMNLLQLCFFLICELNVQKTSAQYFSKNYIQQIMDTEVANKRSKSIVIGVIDSTGRQIFGSGVLSDKDNRKPDGNTLFEIASVTKLFTGLLLAIYNEKNVVALQDPTSKYLPKNVKIPLINKKELNLLHLATHTSGYPRFPYNYDQRTFNNTYSSQELYQYISTFNSKDEYGKRYNYSNTGIGFLGHLLTLRTKQNFETMVKQEICKPLQLNNTTITLNSEQRKNLATGHTAYGKKVSSFYEGELMNPAGGLYSNMNDLLTFAAANIGLQRTTLFSSMQSTQIKRGFFGTELGYDTDVMVHYGMDWQIWTKNGKTLYWHSSTSFGFHSFFVIDIQRKLGVIVLSNSFNAVEDIGLHLIDSTYKIKPYQYNWTLLDTLNSNMKKYGIYNTIKKYKILKQQNSNTYDFTNDETLDFIGNDLLIEKKLKEAIKIFELNIAEFPKSFLAHESMGEMYKNKGDKELAIIYYQKALDIEPDNNHIIWILSKLKK